MTKSAEQDKFQLGQLIRFNAHMLSVAMRTRKPGLEKKKQELTDLKKYLDSWAGDGYPESPDIRWAREQVALFEKWLEDPKMMVIRPVADEEQSRDILLEDLIKDRRSVRFWKKDPVPRKMIDKIIEAGIFAPSAFNRLPWRFFVAETPQEEIREGDASNPGQFEQAPVRIFVSVDERLFFEKYSGALDAGCAMQNMQLMAHHLGLGTCLIYQGEFIDKKILEKHYHIPDYCTTYCVILLGYPDEIPETPARMRVQDAVEYLGEVSNPEF